MCGLGAPVERRGHRYTDLFVITDPVHGDLLVKIRRADECHIERSLQCLAGTRDREGLIGKRVYAERVGAPGASRLRANDQIRAVELLSVRRADTYRAFTGTASDAGAIKEHIDTVLTAGDIV